MIDGKTFNQGLQKFMKAEVTKNARVQIQLPNGEFYDIAGINFLKIKLLVVKETHRLVFLLRKPTESIKSYKNFE